MFHFEPTGHKEWRKDGKMFMDKVLYYVIALKFWDEFNANFALLFYLPSYTSIKMWYLYLKNVEKNNKVVHLHVGPHLSFLKHFLY